MSSNKCVKKKLLKISESRSSISSLKDYVRGILEVSQRKKKKKRKNNTKKR